MKCVVTDMKPPFWLLEVHMSVVIATLLSSPHYQRGEHEVVEELTLDRHEQRVEDATRKETECRRRYPRCAKERR